MTDFNVNHQINDVRREVGSRVLEAGQARTVTISQTFAAIVEDVWDACTNPERIPRWFLPITGELRLQPLCAAGQRVRHDRALRSAAKLRSDLGVRRSDHVDRGAGLA